MLARLRELGRPGEAAELGDGDAQGVEWLSVDGVDVACPAATVEAEKEELRASIAASHLLLGRLQSEADAVAHMERLHTYNECKDTAQALLGVLAVHEGLCTRDLYPEFGLELQD